MPDVPSIMADLQKKGSEKTRKTYARHGMPIDRVLGVSVADLKVIAKTIKGQQDLACALYQTGVMEAMYLAGLVATGGKMTKEQLTTWADGSDGMPMIAEYIVPWVAVEYPQASALAKSWIQSKKDHICCAGWRTYGGLLATKPDSELDLEEISALLGTVVKGVHSASNRVKYTMNGFVIAVGSYVQPLAKEAKAAAKKIGAVSVDMGDTACEVPLATAYIEKVEKAGKAGQKRKTMRC